MTNFTANTAGGESGKKLEAFRVKCSQAGLKITPQRIAVYKALLESTTHPCAETIFNKLRKSFPGISLDTVNRTLLTLSEMGEAFIVEGTGEPKRFDANLLAHQHFKCVKCKRIIDFHHVPFDNIETPEAVGREFTVLRKTAYFEGICDLCGKNGVGREKSS